MLDYPLGYLRHGAHFSQSVAHRQPESRMLLSGLAIPQLPFGQSFVMMSRDSMQLAYIYDNQIITMHRDMS